MGAKVPSPLKKNTFTIKEELYTKCVSPHFQPVFTELRVRVLSIYSHVFIFATYTITTPYGCGVCLLMLLVSVCLPQLGQACKTNQFELIVCFCSFALNKLEISP